MAWMIPALLVALGAAVGVLLMMWWQRCPRCKSMTGPKGLRAGLLPDYIYWSKRMCRKCGHTWEEKASYDPRNP